MGLQNSAMLRLGLVDALRVRALIKSKQGHWHEAEEALQEVIRMAHVMPYTKSGPVVVLFGCRGEACLARSCHTIRQQLITIWYYPYAEANALAVCGQMHNAKGESEAAHAHYNAALAICTRLGERLYAQHIERALAAVSSEPTTQN